MTVQPPSLPGEHQTLGLAWSIPVLLAVYIGIGFGLGRWFGSPIAGVLGGWVAGMAAVFYEIHKVLRTGGGSSPKSSPPTGGGAT